MRLKTLLNIALLGALTAAAVLRADTVTLRGGQTVRGTYLGGNARQVRVDVNGNVQSFDVGQILNISFADENYQQAPPISQAPPPPVRGVPQRPQFNGGLTIPAETQITVRMIDAVNSETSRRGQTFRASLDEPIYVDGQQVVPRGADVLTKLVDDQKSGKLQGRTVLTLALSTITINGQMVDVTSTDVQTASDSRGARTAKVVGGTAALGAVIGAIAGGGQGAAIGAASGAAVGGGAQVLTNGQQVKIPSETRLTFRLQAPVQL